MVFGRWGRKNGPLRKSYTETEDCKRVGHGKKSSYLIQNETFNIDARSIYIQTYDTIIVICD